MPPLLQPDDGHLTRDARLLDADASVEAGVIVSTPEEPSATEAPHAAQSVETATLTGPDALGGSEMTMSIRTLTYVLFGTLVTSALVAILFLPHLSVTQAKIGLAVGTVVYVVVFLLLNKPSKTSFFR